MTIQAPGPQVEAKKEMKMAMNAIWALTAGMLFAIRERVCVVKADGDTDDADEELADHHTKCTVYKNRATAEPLNGVEGDGSGPDID